MSDDYPFTKEAQTLCNILVDYTEGMQPHEARFIEDLLDRFHQFGDETRISASQIQWLRWLEGRYT